MEKREFVATKAARLSKSVAKHVDGLSFSVFFKSLRNKDVKLNGKRISEDVEIKEGDVVEIYFPSAKQDDLDDVIVYSDENILVAYKKSGILSESFYNSLSEEYKELYFIHRLDRNTDGIMVFAKNKTAEKELLDGFKNRTFDKKYLARVFGKMPSKKATLRAFLVKNATDAEVKVYDDRVKGSVEIKTGYEVLSENGETSLLEVTLFTGKTHQIRAHLAHEGHFVVGDGKYGDNAFNRRVGAKSQMLSAYKIKLVFDKKSPLYYLSGREFTAKVRVK